MNAHHRFMLAAALALVAHGALAQEGEPPDLLHSRPRYQLSIGSEPGPYSELAETPSEHDEGTPWGWRLGGMARPSRNWVVAGSYSFHTSRGHERFLDSIVHVPGHWAPGFFGGVYWVDPHDEEYWDYLTIDQDVHSYEACGGRTFPRKWPRRRVFLTGTVLTGMRCAVVRERHFYSFNNTSPPDQTVRVDRSSTGWTWMLRARMDMHVTKFASVYMELISSQPVIDPHVTSSATWNGETRSLSRTRSPDTTVYLGLGMALHL